MARWEWFPASRFADVASRWDALNATTGNLPLLHSDMLAEAIRCFGTGREMVGLLVQPEAAGRVGAAGIFGRHGVGQWSTFQPSQLPVGPFLLDRSVTANNLLASVLPALPGWSIVLSITQQDPAVLARPTADDATAVLDYIDTARVTIAGTFEDYWAARGKNLRANVKKQLSKLASEGIATHVDVLTRPEEMAGAIADYGRLETSGWKAGQGTAVNVDNAQGDFYRSVLTRFARRSAARVYRYRYGERVAAMDLCVESSDTLYILKTAYDESIQGTSPATLMRHAYLPDLVNREGKRRIEFYGRVMEWHRRWTDDVRTMYHVTRYRSPWIMKLRRKLARSAAPAPASISGANAN